VGSLRLGSYQGLRGGRAVVSHFELQINLDVLIVIWRNKFLKGVDLVGSPEPHVVDPDEVRGVVTSVDERRFEPLWQVSRVRKECLEDENEGHGAEVAKQSTD